MLQIGSFGGATRRLLTRAPAYVPHRPGAGVGSTPAQPGRDWGNTFIPPTLGNWVEISVGTSLRLTTSAEKPQHQVQSPPVDGVFRPLYIVDNYNPGDNVRLIGDGTNLDMPIYLPYPVNALHVLGVRMDLDTNLAYQAIDTSDNGTGPNYLVYRNKAPFHVTWTYLYIIEGCMVDAHGISFDIVQLPPTSNGDLVDSNTRELYILNSAFFGMGGIPTGFHGDFIHSADNMMKLMRIENVFCKTSYNCMTLYPIAGVPPCRDAKLRNCSFPTGPVGVDGRTPSNNFAFVGMPTPPQFENVYHPWGAYTDPEGVGHQAAGLQGNTVLPQEDIAPDEFLGEGYLAETLPTEPNLLVNESAVSTITLPSWDDSQGTVYLDDGNGNRRAVSWSPAGYTLVENGVTIEQG